LGIVALNQLFNAFLMLFTASDESSDESRKVGSIAISLGQKIDEIPSDFRTNNTMINIPVQ
jgi:hypothetical protein